ncbi:MAG: protease complex subunit PrcB family protein [Candidatus Omnitrophica bacterium]|nr:protease complex subunit PrcB family protein [Candidatus Omnitrophota bacterium]
MNKKSALPIFLFILFGLMKNTVFASDLYGGIAYQEVISGDNCGYEGKETVVVIRANAAWEKFWSRIKIETFPEPAPSLPKIDFEKEMVIACLMGVQSTGGYTIQVKKIEEGAGWLYVFLETNGGGGLATQEFTSPYQIVRLQKTDLPLSVQVAEHSVKNHSLSAKEAGAFLSKDVSKKAP